MNKSRLIEVFKNETGLSANESVAVVDGFFDQITQALKKGRRVELRGFCSFQIRKYAGYTGSNPKTGEKVKIAPKKLPYFKVGKDLNDRVNRQNR